MSRFWSDHVAGLTPYTPGEQPKIERLLKLNTNEHPYGPSPRALEAIRRGANDALRLYPDNESTALREAVAGFYGVKPAQVMPGNGSDEVLAHVFNALFRHAGRPLLMPDITYSFYKTYCKLFDIPVRLIPLADDFSIRPDDYLNHDEPPAGIIFANPNAPTGIALGLDDIECIARGNPDIAMVVDEAYVDFGADSAIALLDRCPNIVVIHTLSKSRALAGMRVGYSVASVEITEGILRVKDSFNSYPLDRLAIAAAVAAIEDREYFHDSLKKVTDAREALTQQLESMGFEVLPSRTNFVFARHPEFDAATLARGLREQGILVRHFAAPRIDQFLRITVGTPEDCDRLCNALSEQILKTD
ncbi:histidinol-phosphate transaminase [Yanghanlia caeni]|uniref:Histidinol-phosphate aminotransferase n=1 Tax=Yanghanlia caeni TaxID=3064283 RepID=A0ABU1D3K9_9BURK|nr:histidinol-phosphate transaminase [Alcaligenaceae bacterium LG-2]